MRRETVGVGMERLPGLLRGLVDLSLPRQGQRQTGRKAAFSAWFGSIFSACSNCLAAWSSFH